MLTSMLLLGLAMAQEEAQEQAPDDNSYYAGVRAGVSVPIGGKGLAFPLSLEAGVQFPSDLSLGVRLTYQDDPPEVFGRTAPPWAFGPIVDVRYFYDVNRRTDLYGDLGFGFLFGVDERSQENIVLPVATAGIGARLSPGEAPLYIAPEAGLTNFVIPYMGIAVGYVKRAPAR